jgi:formylglycine-generating enzyme required for sulfatase activity
MSFTTGFDECPEDLRMRPAESANLPAEGASPPAVSPSLPVVSPSLPVIATPHTAPTPLPAELAPSRLEASRVARDPETKSIEVPGGLALALVRIPAGEFVMGSAEGDPDEAPRRRVSVPASFWMSRFEITNELYAHFDPAHSSRIEDADYIQFSPGERGWPLSLPRQPVARVSWQRAMDFCRWLSERTGRRFALPTEVQWEYACRAGTETPLSYGALDADFSAYANVSDASHQAIDTFSWAGRAEALPPWRPADARFDDGARVSAQVGSYRPNPWGLHDMHGNVAEWTLSDYRPYDAAGVGSAGGGPVDGASTSGGPTSRGSGSEAPALKKVVRGGSWYDRPDRCRSAFRQAYRPEQPVYDVGFRVTCAEE